MSFVVREEAGEVRRIVLPYAALYYYFMWPTLLVSLLAWTSKSGMLYAVAGVCWLAMLIIAAPMWPVLFELKRRMRAGGITARGSKWSMANPLTYEWREPPVRA